jgi:membrane protein required for beta-lactamase induction
VWNVISKVLYKVLTLLVAIPVAKLVSRLVAKAWQAARPEDPQHDPKRHDTKIADALTWAALAGVGTAASKVLTSKGAAELWRASIGTEPPAKKSKKKKQADEKAAVSPLTAARDKSA